MLLVIMIGAGAAGVTCCCDVELPDAVLVIVVVGVGWFVVGQLHCAMVVTGAGGMVPWCAVRLATESRCPPPTCLPCLCVLGVTL